jgi:hypothetical protein
VRGPVQAPRCPGARIRGSSRDGDERRSAVSPPDHPPPVQPVVGLEHRRAGEGRCPRVTTADAATEDALPRDCGGWGSAPAGSVPPGSRSRDSVPPGPRQRVSVPPGPRQRVSVPPGPRQRVSVLPGPRQRVSVLPGSRPCGRTAHGSTEPSSREPVEERGAPGHRSTPPPPDRDDPCRTVAHRRQRRRTARGPTHVPPGDGAPRASRSRNRSPQEGSRGAFLLGGRIDGIAIRPGIDDW